MRPNGLGQAAVDPEGTGTVSYDPGAPADAIVVLAGSVNLYGICSTPATALR